MKNFRTLKNIIIFNRLQPILNSNFILLSNVQKSQFSRQIPAFTIKAKFNFFSLPGKLYLSTVWKNNQKFAKFIYQNIYYNTSRCVFLKKHLN